jgi:hypothetical protein
LRKSFYYSKSEDAICANPEEILAFIQSEILADRKKMAELIRGKKTTDNDKSVYQSFEEMEGFNEGLETGALVLEQGE